MLALPRSSLGRSRPVSAVATAQAPSLSMVVQTLAQGSLGRQEMVAPPEAQRDR